MLDMPNKKSIIFRLEEDPCVVIEEHCESVINSKQELNTCIDDVLNLLWSSGIGKLYEDCSKEGLCWKKNDPELLDPKTRLFELMKHASINGVSIPPRIFFGCKLNGKTDDSFTIYQSQTKPSVNLYQKLFTLARNVVLVSAHDDQKNRKTKYLKRYIEANRTLLVDHRHRIDHYIRILPLVIGVESIGRFIVDELLLALKEADLKREAKILEEVLQDCCHRILI